MIAALALAIALQPKRPQYSLKLGDTYRYRYEIHREDEVGSAIIGSAVTKVERGGNAELTVTTEVTSPGKETPPGAAMIVPVDRWLYFRGKEKTMRPPWEALARLESPGTRPGAAYSFVPGEGATAVYEVREDAPNSIIKEWRRTVLLDGDRLPLSAEVRSVFTDGTMHVQTLTRLSGPTRSR